MLRRMGLVTPSDAPALLRAAVHDPGSLVRGAGDAQWRGRMGLSNAAQIAAVGDAEMAKA
jgi:hypothetical protein